MDKLISVIVPVYNVRPYLENCVKSIVNQSYKSLEIILIDDGSTDGSNMICDSLAVEDSRITVIHQVNSGLGNARNTGIDNCHGDYITFIDSDDFIEPDSLTRLMATALETDSDIVTPGFIKETLPGSFIPKRDFTNVSSFVGDELKTLVKAHLQPVKGFSREVLNPSVCLTLFRRNVVIHRFHSEKTVGSEDLLFRIEAILNSRKVTYLPDCMYNYRFSEGSLTHSADFSLISRYQTLVMAVGKLVARHGITCNADFLMLLAAIEIVRRSHFSRFNFVKRRDVIKRLCRVYSRSLMDLSGLSLSWREKAFTRCLGSTSHIPLLLLTEIYYRIKPLR